MMEGLRTPTELIVIVGTLLAYGCPLQAIVQASGLDEPTVAAWQKRAGKHCLHVHQNIVQHGKVSASHVQADEIRAQGSKLVIWMGMAIDATSRLWMAGVLSVKRDRHLADRLLQQVRRCCQVVHGLLICTAGWNAYPKSSLRAFRDKVKRTPGRGRCCVEVWPDLCIATIIKHTKKKRVLEVTPPLTQGSLEQAQDLLQKTAGCKEFNTSLIERCNATMRERLASLARQCRHAVHRLETLEAGRYLIGCRYNFCWPHQQLSATTHYGRPCRPAMAAGLSDHLWSVYALLSYKVAPAPWSEPKPTRRRRKGAACDPALPKRAPGRPRKPPLPDPSVPKGPRGRSRKVA